MNESDSQHAQDESSSNRAERDFARRQRIALGALLVFIPAFAVFFVMMLQAARGFDAFAMWQALTLLCLSALLFFCIPFIKGIPAPAVLNEKGELIYSQRDGEFEDMRHLKSSDLTAFLLRWEPPAQSQGSTL